MLIRLEKGSGVPITRQILDQIRTQCASGALQPGDRLPSVRELASELTVNQNTVLRVYERLEAEGLIERRHGAGTFVADQAGVDSLKMEHVQLQREARTLVYHARALGLSAEDLQRLIEQNYQTTEDNRIERMDKK